MNTITIDINDKMTRATISRNGNHHSTAIAACPKDMRRLALARAEEALDEVGINSEEEVEDERNSS